MTPSVSQAEQDYLKTIYELTRAQERATTNEIAGTLDIRAASVTAMLQKLAGIDPPLIDYQKRQGAALTPNGLRLALEVIRHHRLLETFLHEALGYDWDEVHEEADRLEHAISEEMEARIAAFLGDPTHDPHGAPIPSLDLLMPANDNLSLSALQPGHVAIIRRVDDKDADLLRYLDEKGLKLGAKITILEFSAYDQNLTIQLEGAKQPITLGKKITEQIMVEKIELSACP